MHLGLRVNPNVMPDAIPALSVGHRHSRFGEPIERREQIINAFCSDDRLVGLHVHSGSNSQALGPMVEGVEKVVALAQQIELERQRRGRDAVIRYIDIGGGLPLGIDEDPRLSVEHYAALLKARCPALFSGHYLLLTEFGRYYHAAAGWTLSRVEYVRHRGTVDELVLHVGADHFVREVYDATHGSLQFALVDGGGSRGADRNYDLVGPLCFEGDRLGRSVVLPEVRTGDYLVIRHTGANTWSLWSRHCSRAFPKVILYRSASPGGDMAIGKQREPVSDIVEFWS